MRCRDEYPLVRSCEVREGKDRRNLIRWAAFVFLAAALFHLGWIWQGLDMTDEGYNLTNQWLLISAPGHYRFNATVWLSDFLGGVWLKLAGGLGLIGARLGWVFVKAFSAAVAFLILGRFFPKRYVIPAVVAAAIAMYYHGPMVIDYNCLPVAFLLVGIALILSSREDAASYGKRVLRSALGGGMLGVAVMARSPLLVAICFPALPLLVDLLPVGVVVDQRFDVGVPDRLGGEGVGLDPALAQACHGRALGAVDLEDQEVVAAEPHAP